jgi:catalase
MSSTPGGDSPLTPVSDTTIAERPQPGAASKAMRFVLIAVILAAIVGTFAYLGGWLTPNALTPARFVDAFEKVDGVHLGFRRNHAKGVGVSGFFDSNGNGVRLSKAVVFQAGRVPVIGRFSLSGGQPYAADKPDTVRGLGIEFTLPDGELWRTAMVNLPVFPVSTPQAFYERMIASMPDPKTGAPDPAKMREFMARHPEAGRALALIKAEPPSSGFQNTTFHSLNAFRFVNSSGDSVPVRWMLTPMRPVEATMVAAAREDKNYLFNLLIGQIVGEPVQWRLTVIVGHRDDPTNDASVPWPANREQVDVGTLTLDKVESEETSPATDLNFDPLILPAGIEPSDDPLLSARSAVYSQSFTRRAGEVKQRSAITPADLPKGPQ